MTTVKSIQQSNSSVTIPGYINVGRGQLGLLATIVYDVDANTVDRKRLWNTELGDAKYAAKYLVDADGQTGDKEIYLPPVGNGSSQAAPGHSIIIRNVGALPLNIKSDGGSLLATLDPEQYYGVTAVNETSWIASSETPPTSFLRRLEVSKQPYASEIIIPFSTPFVGPPTTTINTYYQPVANVFVANSTQVVAISNTQMQVRTSTTNGAPVTSIAINASEAGDMGSERTYREKSDHGIVKQYGLRFLVELNNDTTNLQYNRSTNEGFSFPNITAPSTITSPSTGRFISVHMNESHNSVSDGPFVYLLRADNIMLYICKGLDDNTLLTWYGHNLTGSVLRTICTLSIDLPDGYGPGDDMIGAYPSILYTLNLQTLTFRLGTAFDGSTIGSAVTVHTVVSGSVVPQGLLKYDDYTIYALYYIGSTGDLGVRSSTNNGTSWSAHHTVVSAGLATGQNDRVAQGLIRNGRMYVFYVNAAATAIEYVVSDDMTVSTWSSTPITVPCNVLSNTLSLYVCVKYLVESDRYVIVYYDVTATAIKMIFSRDLILWSNDITLVTTATNSGSLDVVENNVGEFNVFWVSAAGDLTRLYNRGIVNYTAIE